MSALTFRVEESESLIKYGIKLREKQNQEMNYGNAPSSDVVSGQRRRSVLATFVGRVEISNIYLSVGFDHSLAMTRVDFVPAVGAQSDPLSKNKKKHKTLDIGIEGDPTVFSEATFRRPHKSDMGNWR